MNRLIAIAVLLLACLGARAADEAKEDRADPRFYYDLGPATVDVSAYPKAQQDGYGVFARTCSQCHTLARPINAPYSARADWQRYVRRMHLKTASAAGTRFSRSDAKAIIDFLAYDSKLRKLDGKKAFDAQAEKLKAEFDQVKAARAKKKQEEDRSKVKQPPMPGVGVTPRP